MDDACQAGEKFAELVRILDLLRGENGCPWDKKQDVTSISDYFLEEVFETVHAIYDQDSPAVAEELGDVLLEVVFLARIYKEEGDFSISDVIDGINQKMIRRHPHVFADESVRDAQDVSRKWNRLKRSEKNRSSVLSEVTAASPALLSAYLIGKRASAHGFDWESSEGVILKLKEEIEELTREMDRKEADPQRVMAEMGDILFSLVNICRKMKINPEIALSRTNRKFIRRFQYIEKQLKRQGKGFEDTELKEMDKLWDEAKALEVKKNPKSSE